jgi:hypothetical protein
MYPMRLSVLVMTPYPVPISSNVYTWEDLLVPKSHDLNVPQVSTLSPMDQNPHCLSTSLQIYGQLKFCGLLYGQVVRLLTL